MKAPQSNSTTHMNAITFSSFGEATNLKVSQMTKPTPKDGEVLIKISHTSVNPVDWKIRKGYLNDMLPHVFPVIPGWDAAGTIEELGSGVTQFKKGDRVAAYTRLPTVQAGTYAEYICLPESFLAKLSSDLSFEKAAGVPLVALTALQALSDYQKIKSGSRVLILNGAGGVGSFAIQLAKIMGAHVTTTTSSKNVDYVKSLGADQVIDYTKSTLTEWSKLNKNQTFDFVLDAIGGDTLIESLSLVKTNGQVVSIVDSINSEILKTKSIHGTFHFVYPNGAQLQSIFNYIEAKKVLIPEYKVMSVLDAAQAQLASETHRTRGKLVLSIKF